MREIIYNDDNLLDNEIDEVVVRVKALIINSNNEIILGYSDDTYQFPGGHVEEGEDNKEALIREIKEETGITLGTLNEPFLMIKSYSKNYRDTLKNRENDIYYYLVNTDKEVDLLNTSYDSVEIEFNYTVKLIKLEDFEVVLNNSLEDNPLNEGIIKEMICAFNLYKEIYK